MLSWDPIKLKLYGWGHFARQFPECHWWGITQLILVLQASDVDCTSVKLWKRTYKVWLQLVKTQKCIENFLFVTTFLIVCLHACRLYKILSFYWKRRAADFSQDNAVLAHRHWIYRIKSAGIKTLEKSCISVFMYMYLNDPWNLWALAVEKFKHQVLQYLTFVQ